MSGGDTWDARRAGRALLADEIGTIRKEAARRVALVYPSPYRAAMSSLGYQSIYRQLNSLPGVAADRAMLPDDTNATGQLLTLEREQPVGNYPVIAFSVAYELEIVGVLRCLEMAGVPVLRSQRGPRDPLVIAGGPLTFSNPVPLAPFFDVIVMGEAEEVFPALLDAAAQLDSDRERVISHVVGWPGLYVPDHDGDRMPPVAAASTSLLPARSQIITPNTELRSMFLTEAVRGCSRGCTYCVMRRSTNGGMRAIPPADVLAGIPDAARRVGLVGASVTDHPRIRDIVRGVVDAGREVGISSLRADKLDDELVGLLARGGYRTLTVAGDGASERMRRVIERRTNEQHLVRTAELAKRHRLHTVKIYIMLGVPGETDEDVDELVRFCLALSKIHHRIALGVAPFVAKRRTPLDGTAFAGIPIIEARLRRLRKGLRGRVKVRPISVRWAWVEYMLAQGTSAAGLAVMDAHAGGGTFAAFKRAFAERGCEPTGPVARVPSTSELIALKKKRLAQLTVG